MTPTTAGRRVRVGRRGRDSRGRPGPPHAAHARLAGPDRLVGAVVLSLCVGAVAIGPGQVAAILVKQVGIGLPWSFEGRQESVLLAIRLPRVVLGVVVGAGLAAGGSGHAGHVSEPAGRSHPGRYR